MTVVIEKTMVDRGGGGRRKDCTKVRVWRKRKRASGFTNQFIFRYFRHVELFEIHNGKRSPGSIENASELDINTRLSPLYPMETRARKRMKTRSSLNHSSVARQQTCRGYFVCQYTSIYTPFHGHYSLDCFCAEESTTCSTASSISLNRLYEIASI